MKTKVLSIIYFLFIGSISMAQTMFENNNFNRKLDSIKQEAAKGNIVAIHELGNHYNWGFQNCPVDYKKAIEYYLKSAEYGYPLSQFEIARMYSVGKGVTSNKELSAEWHAKAFENFKIYANRGDGNAMSHLGDYYAGYNGDEFKDYTKAVYWYLRGLEVGYVDCASNMSLCYKFGKGVEENKEFACVWDARFCIESEKKKWPTKEYLSYEELCQAGYAMEDWERLAKYTHIQVPRFLADQEDSIRQAMLLAIDILNVKIEEFQIEKQLLAFRKQNNPTQNTVNTDSHNSLSPNDDCPHHTQQTFTRPKRKWLSVLGNVLETTAALITNGRISPGQTLTGRAQTQQLQQLFSYNGTARQGQQDANGRIIKNEFNAPAPMGQSHYTWYQDGFCHVTTVTTCVSCYGKRTCYICQGKGQYYHAYFKNYQPCPTCFGQGVCHSCKGQGFVVSTKLWVPGEADVYLQAQREIEHSHSSSQENKLESSSVCPDCNGKGYRPESYIYAAGSRLAPYHNSAGNTCPICNKLSDHYHYRCTTCKKH